MRLLEERILQDGVVKAGDVLKVDTFLNHQLDMELIDQMGKEFHRLFADCTVDKIMTVESSGIAIAALTAKQFGVPMVFAKKAQSINLDGDVYTTKIQSFTHQRIYDVIVSKKMLQPGEHVLIIDDFLANGCAVQGLVSLLQDAKTVIEGVGIAIEKGQMPGGRILREAGLRVESLAIIESMDAETGRICFRSEEEERNA